MTRVGVLKGRYGGTSDSLSQKCLISSEATRRTVHHITKQGISTIIHPYMSSWLKTNDWALRYNRLQKNGFTYTMQVGTVSRRMNKYALVYSTEFGWSRAHMMKIMRIHMKPCLYSSREMLCRPIRWCMYQRSRHLDCSERCVKRNIST